jgi:hypothetical protein
LICIDGHVLLKQQLSFTVYPLPINKNKSPFSISVRSKQAEVCRFCFLFAEKK